MAQSKSDLIIRESSIARGIGWAAAFWSLLFAVDLVIWGDSISSKQWLYLFDVPGGHHSWATLFIFASLFLIIGLMMNMYYLIAIGSGIICLGCSAIVAFYVWAPVFEPGLSTPGFFAWAVPAILACSGTIINLKEIKWS